MNLDALFLLHLVVESEDVEIAVLHLEGEANIWWFNHLSHARVIAYAYFTQRLIKNFDRRKSEEIPINTFPNIDEKKHEDSRGDISIITP